MQKKIPPHDKIHFNRPPASFYTALLATQSSHLVPHDGEPAAHQSWHHYYINLDRCRLETWHPIRHLEDGSDKRNKRHLRSQELKKNWLDALARFEMHRALQSPMHEIPATQEYNNTITNKTNIHTNHEHNQRGSRCRRLMEESLLLPGRVEPTLPGLLLSVYPHRINISQLLLVCADVQVT